MCSYILHNAPLVFHLALTLFLPSRNMQSKCHFVLSLSLNTTISSCPPTAFPFTQRGAKNRKKGLRVVSIDTNNCCIWQITGRSAESRATPVKLAALRAAAPHQHRASGASQLAPVLARYGKVPRTGHHHIVSVCHRSMSEYGHLST